MEAYKITNESLTTLGISLDEFFNHFDSGEKQFQIANYNFIKETKIDEIMTQMMIDDSSWLSMVDDDFKIDFLDICYETRFEDIEELLNDDTKLHQFILDNDYMKDCQIMFSECYPYQHFFEVKRPYGTMVLSIIEETGMLIFNKQQ